MPLDVRWPFPQCPALAWRISSSLIMGMVGSYSYFWTSKLDYTCAHWYTHTHKCQCVTTFQLFLILLLVVCLLCLPTLHIQSTWTAWQSTTTRFCLTWLTIDHVTRLSSRCQITSPVWMTHTSGVRRTPIQCEITPSFLSGLPGWIKVFHILIRTVSGKFPSMFTFYCRYYGTFLQ